MLREPEDETPNNDDGEKQGEAERIFQSKRTPQADRAEIVSLVIAEIGEVQREINAAEARRTMLIEKARMLAEAASHEIVLDSQTLKPERVDELTMRSLVAEVAATLRISESQARTLVHEARTLERDLPATREALERGHISYRHAKAVVDESWSLPADAASDFENTLLPAAQSQTPHRFRDTARTLRERLHPETIRERKRRARDGRHVEFEALHDGMAYVGMIHTAEVAGAVYNATLDVARGIRAQAGETRTFPQIAADVFADAALAGFVHGGDDAEWGDAEVAEDAAGEDSVSTVEAILDDDAVTAEDAGQVRETAEGSIVTGPTGEAGATSEVATEGAAATTAHRRSVDGCRRSRLRVNPLKHSTQAARFRAALERRAVPIGAAPAGESPTDPSPNDWAKAVSDGTLVCEHVQAGRSASSRGRSLPVRDRAERSSTPAARRAQETAVSARKAQEAAVSARKAQETALPAGSRGQSRRPQDSGIHNVRRGLGMGFRRAAIRPSVHITVPALALLGHSAEPATLEGFGPIDIETARELTASAPSLTRILTHPETGAVLSVGKESYRVPAALKKALVVRDETCRFPACNRKAEHCDLDHTIDWQFGGETSIDNLAHVCREHHVLKHETAWRVAQDADGSLEWTSPGGAVFGTKPAHVVRREYGDNPPF